MPYRLRSIGAMPVSLIAIRGAYEKSLTNARSCVISRGFLGIKVWMEKVSGESQGLNNRTNVYIIRSNIGPDGYPPRLPGIAS